MLLLWPLHAFLEMCQSSGWQKCKGQSVFAMLIWLCLLRTQNRSMTCDCEYLQRFCIKCKICQTSKQTNKANCAYCISYLPSKQHPEAAKPLLVPKRNVFAESGAPLSGSEGSVSTWGWAQPDPSSPGTQLPLQTLHQHGPQIELSNIYFQIWRAPWKLNPGQDRYVCQVANMISPFCGVRAPLSLPTQKRHPIHWGFHPLPRQRARNMVCRKMKPSTACH